MNATPITMNAHAIEDVNRDFDSPQQQIGLVLDPLAGRELQTPR